MSNFAPKRTSYDTGDRRWARNFLGLSTHDVTLNGSAWPAGQVIPSGTHIGADGGPKDEDNPTVGLLVNDVRVNAGERHLVAVASGGGPVDRRFLPAGHTTADEAVLTAINFIN